MNLEERILASVDTLELDEQAIVQSLNAPFSDQIDRSDSKGPLQSCRGSFLVELLKAALSDEDRIAIRIPNIRLVSEMKATSLKTEKTVSLPNLVSEFPVCFDQCAFGQLELVGAQLHSFLARGFRSESDLVLRSSRISHVLDLSIARIGGTLDLKNAILTVPGSIEEATQHAGDTAQSESGAVRREAYPRFEMGSLVDVQIDGSLRLCNARIDRKIRMTNARIGGDVDLWGAEFQDIGEMENGLICTNCEIGEKLVLSESRCDDKTRIALDYSRMRILQFGRDTAS